MRRRDFLHAIGASVAAGGPLDALAQQPAMPVIGVLGSETEFDKIFIGGLRQGLSESGFVEGQNLTIEYRWAEGAYDRLPGLATDLIRQKVAVLVASSTPALAAAKAATATIPIVFNTGADPVAAGFVASLNRPGGNLTGVTILLTQVVPKQFELLREMIPRAPSIGFLHNPTNRTFAESVIAGAQAAARKLAFKLQVLEASTERGVDDAFATSAQLRLGGLVIGPDQFFTNRSEQLGALTIRHALPAIYHYRGFAAAGGLMSYGASLPEAYRLEGAYVGRILKGEKPGELPVQQSTKVELIVNLKTAKALGLTVPLPLLGRADEVIE
jgi:putative tryptophan/tyrosine transport system substrate-binding protein